MSNSVVHFVPTAGNQQLGSYTGDRNEFSIYGSRPNTQANRDIVSLTLELHREYSNHSGIVLSQRMRNETVLGTHVIGGVGYPVHVRTRPNCTVAFCCQLLGKDYETVLLAAETNPPLHGLQNWWRIVVHPRLQDWI